MTDPNPYKWAAQQIKEGRGQGTGAEYRPWIHVREFSSRGKSSRLKSWKSGRTLQLFSDIELAFAYLLDWSDDVIDYYEQFPLLPLEETLEIGSSIGYKHPARVKNDAEPRVRTTDFLIHRRADGAEPKTARATKSSADLSKKNLLLSLEVERRYWAKRQFDWAIVTEMDLPLAMVKNIDWLHSARDMEDHEVISKLPIEDVVSVLRAALDLKDQPLAHACLNTDKRLGLSGGTCLFLVRHQLAIKKWRVDMHKEIKTNEVLELLADAEAPQKTEPQRGVA